MFASGKTAAVASAANYIEEVFSTYLYTGNGSTQTITNGIDLAGKGGLVWWKNRTNATGHGLIDTTRGIDYYLSSNTTDAQDGPASYISSVSSTGYSIGVGTQFVNQSANNYASWTFRKQPKFFDVVTYTGDGGTQNIAHSLGSTPGCIIVKRTNTTGSWRVFHTSVSTQYGNLNSTAAFQTTSAENVWGNNSTTVAPTSTQFTVGNDSSLNASGSTYVAYLFAHNAGGFGLTGTDNVISCGSFTSDGSSPISVNLGYEPQWVLVKASTAAGYDWWLFDNMRGTPVGSGPQMLRANTSGAETTSSSSAFQPNATGFTADGSWLGASTFIYIAIRRGPMKVPTSGTSVFSPQTATGYQSPNIVTDSVIFGVRGGASYSPALYSRLQGSTPYLITSSTDAEATGGSIGFDSSNGINYSVPSNWITYYFKRAPSFFDEVCYTGTGSARTVTHNLGVAPELLIVKSRSQSGGSWNTWTTGFTISSSSNEYVALNSTSAKQDKNTSEFWGSSYPTASVFSIGTNYYINNTGDTYVAYLFATCAGVSKVGSYTGDGTVGRVIDCGFTSGARFIMLKKTSTTSDWYVYDTARGIVSGGEKSLSLNTTAAESGSADVIDPDSSGFAVGTGASDFFNESGVTYIYLAIA